MLWFSNAIWIRDKWTPFYLLVYWSNIQMVSLEHWTQHLNTKPFEIWNLKSLVFKCFQYLNGRYSDPHCALNANSMQGQNWDDFLPLPTFCGCQFHKFLHQSHSHWNKINIVEIIGYLKSNRSKYGSIWNQNFLKISARYLYFPPFHSRPFYLTQK